MYMLSALKLMVIIYEYIKTISKKNVWNMYLS
jgi:hypothetical protein